MSLKLRLALLLSTLLLAAILSFSAALIWSERRSLMEAASAQQASAAGGLADVCRNAVVGGQELLLTNYLKRLAGHPEVAEALCADSEGRVIGHTDLARLHAVLPGLDRLAADLEAPRVFREGPFDAALAPATLGARRVGLAKVVYSRDRILRRIEGDLALVRRRIWRTSAAVILAAFCAALLVTRWAIRPVDFLVQGVRTIAGGRLDHKIPLQRNDELGLLSREFNRMAERLTELDRMKQDFVSTVTHDLKSPLTAIKSAAEVLRSGREPSDKETNLDIIHRNADRLGDLIASILEVSHIESGLSLVKRPLLLEDLAHRVVGDFRPAALKKGLALELVVSQDLPPVQADAGKLERAVANLVGNAVKFTEKGRVQVDIGLKDGFQELRVSDTGPGIPPAFMDKLFTKFSRGRPDDAGAKGTGLGLTIVKGIAEAHGGSVRVENHPGAGAAFTLRLPS